MTDKKPKLYYFQARGRAELIRLVFAAAGADFEDIRYSREQWPEHKKTAPTGVLPYLECGEHGALVQSGAIARYYARKYHLMGSNDWEYYLIERTMGQLEDIFQEFVKIMFAPEDKKADLAKEFEGDKGQRLFGCLVRFLKEGGDAGFFAGKSLSLADLACVALYDMVAPSRADFLAKFPELAKHKAHVMAANAKVGEWIKKRPETPF